VRPDGCVATPRTRPISRLSKRYGPCFSAKPCRNPPRKKLLDEGDGGIVIQQITAILLVAVAMATEMAHALKLPGTMRFPETPTLPSSTSSLTVAASSARRTCHRSFMFQPVLKLRKLPTLNLNLINNHKSRNRV
jgi:hypothetical protein